MVSPAMATSRKSRCMWVSEHSARTGVTWTWEYGMWLNRLWGRPCFSLSQPSSSVTRRRSVCWTWICLTPRRVDTSTPWCQWPPPTLRSCVAGSLLSRVPKVCTFTLWFCFYCFLLCTLVVFLGHLHQLKLDIFNGVIDLCSNATLH